MVFLVFLWFSLCFSVEESRFHGFWSQAVDLWRASWAGAGEVEELSWRLWRTNTCPKALKNNQLQRAKGLVGHDPAGFSFRFLKDGRFWEEPKSLCWWKPGRLARVSEVHHKKKKEDAKAGSISLQNMPVCLENWGLLVKSTSHTKRVVDPFPSGVLWFDITVFGQVDFPTQKDEETNKFREFFSVGWNKD